MIPNQSLLNIITPILFYVLAAILSWCLVILLGYGIWIVARETVSLLEDILRVLLQIP